MAVYQALNWGPTGNVAVKLSTGEPPASNYLDPNLIKDVVQEVDCAIVECNTTYGSSRATTAMHYQVAKDHGFTDIAEVVILDENGSISLPVTGGTQLTENYVGARGVRLKGRLRSQFVWLYEQGVRRFYVDGALGVGQWSGEIILRLKEQPEYQDIEFVIVLPYPGHDARWDERSRQRLAFLIRHSMEYLTVGKTACWESFLQRNRYMVDHADCLVAVYDGVQDSNAGESFMVGYAKKKGLPMLLIHPDIAVVTTDGSMGTK